MLSASVWRLKRRRLRGVAFFLSAVAALRFTLDQAVNLVREPFELARRRRYVDGKPGLGSPDDPAFDPSEPIKVGDDAVPNRSSRKSLDANSDWRNILCLTWKFASIGEHVTSWQRQRKAGITAALFG
jgi:hypothetical protein